MAQHSLENLLAAIGQSIKWALNSTDQFALNSFMDEFDQTSNEKGEVSDVVPKMVKVPFPSSDGTWKVRDVPKAALLNHSSLQIDDLRVKMKVRITESKEGGPLQCELHTTNGEDDTQKAGISPTMAEIEVGFKRGDPPEGLAKITTELNKSI